MSKRIVFIIGSLRQGSFNRQVAQVAAELIGDRAEVSFLDYSDVPFMNQDLESPAPAPVTRVREEILAADGIWIFTPEYNHQVPGVLKNLLDWLSRPLKPGEFGGKTAVAGKPVTVSGAGGKRAAVGSREQLIDLLEVMRMQVIRENETGVALPAEAFATGRYEMEDDVRRQLSLQADGFLTFMFGGVIETGT